jgi:hypothetical protein
MKKMNTTNFVDFKDADECFVHRTISTNPEGDEFPSVHAFAAEYLIRTANLNNDNHILYGVGVGLRDASHAKTILSDIFFGEDEFNIRITCDALLKKNQEEIIQFIDTFRGLSSSDKEKYCREFAEKHISKICV